METKVNNVKLIKEADSNGLELLGPGKDANFRLYRFKKCKHRQEISTTQVRNGNPICRKCYDQNLRKKANSVGLELLVPGKTTSYRLYKCKKCDHKQEIQPCMINRGDFKCQNCHDQNLIKEAKSVGLELLGPGKNAHYRLYKFEECGHEQEIQTTQIRNGKSKCKECFDEKLMKEAKSVGLELLGSGKNANYRLYRFEECGHEQEIQPSRVRVGRFKCQNCHDQKLIKEAKSVGLELLGPGKSSSYRLYKFKECGHEQEITPRHVRDKNFRCNKCYDEKLIKEAKSVELEIIGQAKNMDYRLYKFKECGHEQEIKTCHVRNKNFKCRTCKGVWLKDGRLVKSNLEKQVGDFLIERGFKFQYEKYLSSKSNHKTDFYLVEKNIYIEVAGYINEISITKNNCVDELILEFKNDSLNYRGYTDKLINKISTCYRDKKLIVLTSKNLNDDNWKEFLEIDIGLME